MPQNRIEIGSHGAIHPKPFTKLVAKADAKTGVKRTVAETWYRCRVLVRDADGRRREVTATGRTKGEAERNVRAALARRGDPTTADVNGHTTVSELASIWFQFRRDHGKARSEGPLAGQSLGGYAATILNQVDPALGAVRVDELSVPRLNQAFANVEHGRRQGRLDERKGGRSTAQMRAVLSGMLELAVSYGAIPSNYIRDCAPSSRGGRRRSSDDIDYLDVAAAIRLRHLVRREVMRIPGRVMGSPDLEELVDLLLGTGARAGEGLAVRLSDFTNLRRDDEPCLLTIAGTLIEPRKEADVRDRQGNVTQKGYRHVEELHRQPYTKTGTVRTVVLPDLARDVVRQRVAREGLFGRDSLLFQTASGKPISPSNLRTRLRTALQRAASRDDATDLDRALMGTTFHTLRRSVGTLVAHEVSLDAARWQLGHSDPSVTFQHYVAQRTTAPDVRHVLDQFFGELPELGVAVGH